MLLGVFYYISTYLENIDNNVMNVFKSLNNRAIDFEIYQAWQEDEYLVASLRNKIKSIAKDFGYYSTKFGHHLDELFRIIEFKINGSSVSKANDFIYHQYSVEYIVNKNGDSHEVVAIIARSKIKTQYQMKDYIGLFINVIVGLNHVNKISMKFSDRGKTELEPGYTIFRGKQNELVLITKNKSLKGSKQLVEHALDWIKNQTLLRIENLELMKLKNNELANIVVKKDIENEKKVFNLDKSIFLEAILRLDVTDNTSKAKVPKLVIRRKRNNESKFWEGGISLDTRLNLEIILDEFFENHSFMGKNIEISEAIGDMVCIGKDNDETTLELKVGKNYYGAEGRSWSRLTCTGWYSTLIEYMIFLALRNIYLEQKVLSSVNIKRLDVLSKAKNIGRELGFSVLKFDFSKYTFILRQLAETGIIAYSSDGKVLRWMNTSEDVIKSYKYIFCMIIRNQTGNLGNLKKLRRFGGYDSIRNLIKNGFIFKAIEGSDIIKKPYEIVPIKHWKIYIFPMYRIKGGLINGILNNTFQGKRVLPSDTTIKNRIKEFVSENPSEIEIISNSKLDAVGYIISKKYFILYEGDNSLSQHFGISTFDNLYRKITGNANKSILGKGFKGLHIRRSDIETAKNRNKLWTSSDLNLIDQYGRIVGNGITKGINYGNSGARQLLEQLFCSGKRFILFIDFNYSVKGGLGEIYVGKLGVPKEEDYIVKSQIHQDDMFFASLFHHETWKKMDNLLRKKKMFSYLLHWGILKQVEEKVISNPKNGYTLNVINRWNEYKFKLINNFGFERLSKGIIKALYDEWWAEEVKKSLIWKPYAVS
ncbi:MAG: hypothetical protein ACFFAE_02775 [Candidatus Hodarchaeota archaeon]